MRAPRPPLPRAIGGIPVPQDEISRAAWERAWAILPTYLFTHSVRSYCWAAALGKRDGLPFEARILWAAALFHDVGLTRIPRATACFEYEGAEVARRFVARLGMPAVDADRVARAIILHMAPSVTLADGAESVLLDRATGLDVRGAGYELVDDVRDAVVAAFPRGSFDRLFVNAIRREVATRPGCQSERLLRAPGFASGMASSPWVTRGSG